MFKQTTHTPEIFAGEHGRRNGLLMIWQINVPSHLLYVVIAKHTTVATPGSDQKRYCMLIGKEFPNLLFEVDHFKRVFPKLWVLRDHVLFVHVAVQRILINLRELILVVVLQQRRGIRMYFRRLAIEDNFPR